MRVHMMAICGTGMGSLAGLLKARGFEVTGCDSALYPPMSEALTRYGIEAQTGFDKSHLDSKPDLVIIGNAIHRDNPEAKAAIERGVEYLSMAEAVRRFAVDGRESLVVAGTHGKTTTTAIVGFLLKEAGLDPNVLVGGVVRGWETSFRWGGGGWTVLEGDEYETAFFDKGPKFLHYDPSILVLNNIEMDHRDNFENMGEVETAFVRLFGVVRPGGLIIAGTESPTVAKLLPIAGRRIETFGLSGGEEWRAEAVNYGVNATVFKLCHKEEDLGVFESPLFGQHNLRNVLAALAASISAGADPGALKSALPNFAGVKRRQEVVYDDGSLAIVDDFAHHPTAIEETIRGLRQRYVGRRIVACFEPRSYTCRTRVHQKGLPGALSPADEVFLGPFNPHPKIPEDERLDLSKVASELEGMGVATTIMDSFDAYYGILDACRAAPALLVFFSSGPFDDLPARLAARASLLNGGVVGRD